MFSLARWGAEARPEPTPVSYREDLDAAAFSVIGSELMIAGEVLCEGHLQVEGTVEGTIYGRSVTVGRSAHVEGHIFADAVRIRGSVSGRIESVQVVVGSTARINGDIIHNTLSIEPGAQIHGRRPWRPLPR